MAIFGSSLAQLRYRQQLNHRKATAAMGPTATYLCKAGCSFGPVGPVHRRCAAPSQALARAYLCALRAVNR